MTRQSWDEIDVSLREEIGEKRAAYLQAKKEFDRALIPSDVSQPDGVLDIKDAGASHTIAVTAYRLALMEQHDFHLSGVITSRFTLDGPPYPRKW
jgi:hypothetical protein